MLLSICLSFVNFLLTGLHISVSTVYFTVEYKSLVVFVTDILNYLKMNDAMIYIQLHFELLSGMVIETFE